MGNCRLDSNGKCRKSFFVRRSSRSLRNGISRSRCVLFLYKPTYVVSFCPSFIHKIGSQIYSIGRQLLPIYSNFDRVAFGKSAGEIPKHHQIKTTWRSPNLFGVFEVLWTPNLDIVYFYIFTRAGYFHSIVPEFWKHMVLANFHYFLLSMTVPIFVVQ